MRSRQAPIFRSSRARTPEQLGWPVCGRTRPGKSVQAVLQVGTEPCQRSWI